MVNDDRNVVLIIYSYPLCACMVTTDCWIPEEIFCKNNHNTKQTKSVPNITLETSQQELI